MDEVFRVVEFVGGPFDGQVIGQMMLPTVDRIERKQFGFADPHAACTPMEWFRSVYVSAGRSSARGEVFEYRGRPE